MRWIQQTRNLLLNERGSVMVDYIVIFAAIAWSVTIIMGVVTDRRFELGNTMGDVLDEIIIAFTYGRSGQANFGHAIYPTVDPVHFQDAHFQDGPVSLARLVQNPANQTVVQPALQVEVQVDRQGRIHLHDAEQDFTAIYDPTTEDWYLRHTGTDEVMRSDLATIHQLGLVELQSVLAQVAGTTLGVSSVLTSETDATGTGLVALISTTLALLAGRSITNLRTQPAAESRKETLSDKASGWLQSGREWLGR